jgi:predicted Zn-dependent protease
LRANATFASLPQFAAVRTRQRRHAFGRSLGWTVLAVFVFFPVLAIALFVWQADRIAHFAADRVSIADEVELGDGAFAQMSESLELADSGAPLDVLQTLGKRLTPGSKYKYRIHVAASDVVNAFALPGGIIVVNTGLINATRRPEELAGVLAHEIQHVERRHSLVALVKDMGLRGVWLLVTGDVGSSVFGRAALELTSLSFSRDAEAEADTRGFDTLVATGIDPSGMPDFFQVLAKQDGAAPPPFLSTHPASGDRDQKLRARVDQLQQRHFEPLDFGKWPPQLTPEK